MAVGTAADEDPTSLSSSARAELEERFGAGLPADVVTEALSVLRIYALTPADLYFKWEAFLLANTRQQGSLAFTLDNLRELRKDIQLSASSSNNGKREAGTSTPGGQAATATRMKKLGGRAALDGILDGAPATPLAKRAKMGMGGTGGPSTPFNNTVTPMARSSLANGMRPSSSYTPAGGAASSTPVAHGKTAFPSHLSRSSGQPNSPSLNGIESPSSSSSVRFEDRQNALEVVETLNPHLSAIVGTATESNTPRIALASNANPKDYIYRYMFEKVTDRATVLDNAIDEAADLVMQYYGLDDIGNPEHPSQDDIYCVGRICPEGDTVRLTDTSLQLESSRRYGGGMRVPLRFDADVLVRSSDDPAFSTGEGGTGLFPGMIVGLKGRNPGGGFFTASEILLLPPVDQPQTSVAELIDYQHGAAKLAGQAMSIVTACGPFTVDDDLSYAPFAALMEEMANLRPDLLILLGPFIDSSHPLLKTGEVDGTPQQIFQEAISSKLSSFLEYSLNTSAILIPSVKDMISHNVVYPQAPLEREGLNLHKRAKLLPNPAIFSVNEVVFAVTSADTLFSLKQNEFFKRARDAQSTDPSSDPSPISSLTAVANKDVMARMCRHVLRQRSFYPLFPAPSAPPLDPINLDVTHSNLLRFDQGTGADVFILPSMLKHFAKVVDSAVMVNPATMTKRNQAGTFAKMTIYPTPQRELEEMADSMEVDDDDEEKSLEHRVYERIRVDIVKI